MSTEKVPEFKNCPVETIAVFSDFHPRYPKDKAQGMLRALTVYASTFLDWTSVIKSGVCTAPTLNTYFKDDIFRKRVDEIGPLAVQFAMSVYHSAMIHAPWPERLKAADRILAAYKPEVWDQGVRRELAKAQIALDANHLKQLQGQYTQTVDLSVEIDDRLLLEPEVGSVSRETLEDNDR